MIICLFIKPSGYGFSNCKSSATQLYLVVSYHLGEELSRHKDSTGTKLPALVYNILPSTTAVFGYAIGPRKLSANEQFFVGAQTVVSLLQTTQIISGVGTDHVAYFSIQTIVVLFVPV